MKNLEEALQNAKRIEKIMDINELYGEIVNLGLKYSKGTKINNLTVDEFETLCNVIHELIINPTEYITNKF